MHEFAIRITQAAIRSAHTRLLPYSRVPLEDAAELLGQHLEEACKIAAVAKMGEGVCELLDVLAADDLAHYLYVLHVGENPPVLGLAADDRRSGKVLITVCTLAEGRRNVTQKQWQTVDGKALFPALLATPSGTDVRQANSGHPPDPESFVRALLLQNPNISVRGKGGISDQVKARFGVGMREARVAKIRAQSPGISGLQLEFLGAVTEQAAAQDRLNMAEVALAGAQNAFNRAQRAAQALFDKLAGKTT